MIFCIKRWLKAIGIAQNCHILVFFREFRRGKDNLQVRKDEFDAVFFSLSTSPNRPVGESPSRGVAESGSRFSLTNIDKWKCKGDNLIAFISNRTGQKSAYITVWQFAVFFSNFLSHAQKYIPGFYFFFRTLPVSEMLFRFVRPLSSRESCLYCNSPYQHGEGTDLKNV